MMAGHWFLSKAVLLFCNEVHCTGRQSYFLPVLEAGTLRGRDQLPWLAGCCFLDGSSQGDRLWYPL